MIIDIHTHFWRDEDHTEEFLRSVETTGGINPKFRMTSAMHLEATKAVDKAVVFGLRSKGTSVPNDIVKAQVDLAPGRLIFFTSVNPSEEDYMEELERTHQDMGARGIKLGPIYQGVHPLDKRYHDIYRYAEKHRLPIVIHMATTFVRDYPLEYARPIHMDQVAIDYPDLTIILAHLGHPWMGETIAIIRRHPNVYADLSALYYRPWQFYNGVQLLVEYGSWKKALFGSDYPFTQPGDSVEGLKNINHIVEGSPLPKIPDEVIETILYRDTVSLLGL